jgi:hypothetical protein
VKHRTCCWLLVIVVVSSIRTVLPAMLCLASVRSKQRLIVAVLMVASVLALVFVWHDSEPNAAASHGARRLLGVDEQVEQDEQDEQWPAQGSVINCTMQGSNGGKAQVQCQGQEFQQVEHDGGWRRWVDIGVSCSLVVVAGLMSGLTMGLMSLDALQLQIVLTSGEEHMKRHGMYSAPVLLSLLLMACPALAPVDGLSCSRSC